MRIKWIHKMWQWIPKIVCPHCSTCQHNSKNHQALERGNEKRWESKLVDSWDMQITVQLRMVSKIYYLFSCARSQPFRILIAKNHIEAELKNVHSFGFGSFWIIIAAGQFATSTTLLSFSVSFKEDTSQVWISRRVQTNRDRTQSWITKEIVSTLALLA